MRSNWIDNQGLAVLLTLKITFSQLYHILYLQDENEEEEDLLDKAGGVLTSVLKEYKDQAMPLIDKLMPQIGQMLDQSRSAGERRVAICILDDLLEHSSAGIQALSIQQSTILLYSIRL